MSVEPASKAGMAKTYDHRQVEEKRYDFWDRGDFFRAEIDWSKPPYTISMPPPNITGVLTHGHAMMVAFEDLMIRWRRMQGYASLYLPGTDHAGIATQNAVEKELAREGLTRHDLGREAFVARVWRWREEYGRKISGQLRALGTSCDWSRERFTLDEGLSRAVREAFLRLYHKGLVYRGSYIVNWCPRCTTVISDLEVEHHESEGRLWTVRYRIEGGGEIQVATTRPETILGDTAVAVHPEDERYRALVGRTAILPALGRRIPVIADPLVDPSFGTGAVKVTPGHDPSDYEIGQRHGLPIVNVMQGDGTLNAEAGPYAGMDRYRAREALLRDLVAHGLLVREEPHQLSVGHCERCETVIEPLVSEQWFVNQRALAEPAMRAVNDGRIKFVPERFTRIYMHWLENVRDWPISRQLWWGHRIPIWHCATCGELVVPRPGEPDPNRCSKAHTELGQDPDVLDTWFSSALWPFSTLGWPDSTSDLRYFHPTDVLETGYDIIFFWVARMIMMGLELTGDIPFHHVYLHGIIRHGDGTKISKSNFRPGDDPLEVISDYGADALRLWIVTGSSPGNDIRLSFQRIESTRNFTNKLWNTVRFVAGAREQLLSDDESVPALASIGPDTLHVTDRWILSRCHGTVAEATRLMEEYLFGEAGRLIEDFVWNELADWYIEATKLRLYAGAGRRAQAAGETPALAGTPSPAELERETEGEAPDTQHPTPHTHLVVLSVLHYVLDMSLRLLHPFMPFVTEEAWQHLVARMERGHDATPALMVAPWPRAGKGDTQAEREFGLAMGLVRGIRSARAEAQIEAARWVPAVVAAGEHLAALTRLAPEIEALARVRPLELYTRVPERPRRALTVLAGQVEAYVPLAGLEYLKKDRARLDKDRTAALREFERIVHLLTRPGFVDKAPPHVVEAERSRLVAQRDRLVKLDERLAVLAKESEGA